MSKNLTTQWTVLRWTCPATVAACWTWQAQSDVDGVAQNTSLNVCTQTRPASVLLSDTVLTRLLIDVQGGAFIYACRWPERLKPGRFDYLFNSHQLFHLAVVIAAFVHYHAVLVSSNCALVPLETAQDKGLLQCQEACV